MCNGTGLANPEPIEGTQLNKFQAVANPKPLAPHAHMGLAKPRRPASQAAIRSPKPLARGKALWQLQSTGSGLASSETITSGSTASKIPPPPIHNGTVGTSIPFIYTAIHAQPRIPCGVHSSSHLNTIGTHTRQYASLHPTILTHFFYERGKNTGNALTALTPSITASIPATETSGTSANPVNQLTLLTSLLGGQSLHNERLFIASGIPTVPKKLVAQMRDFKFIDLADLLPPRDAHEGLVPETHSQRYTFFPGWELVRPKRRQVTEIVDWVCAYAIYMACMAQQSPQFIPEMIAHLLTVVRTSEEYEGL